MRTDVSHRCIAIGASAGGVESLREVVATTHRGLPCTAFRGAPNTALFRSVAYAYGFKAIGVVLSGALDDGTSGLWSVKRLGGIAVVQTPSKAKFESMPRSALEYVHVDHTLPSTEIGALLARLVAEYPLPDGDHDAASKELMAKEVQIAVEGGAFQKRDHGHWDADAVHVSGVPRSTREDHRGKDVQVSLPTGSRIHR